MSRPWHLTARVPLSLWDRLRLIAGVGLWVRFLSPDGECHAACAVVAYVRGTWPEDEAAMPPARGWPPIPRAFPPPPAPPAPPPNQTVRKP